MYHPDKRFAITLLCSLLLLQLAAQTTHRPKIGITLSGGGAKGLAHIGILKAIDSAGLKVDYITGTSMGSIIGGLYAVGYSADTLETIARNIDWASLLSNQAPLTDLKMEEKNEYGKYAIELPWINHRFKVPIGLLEAEELWMKFDELFFPVYKIKDFSKFSIPFKCISTNISDGSIVVLDKGEVIKAIRSSMAIPSFFTAVDYDSVKLVDGGIVRNFPVREVKDMGADFVIGSSVSGGLLPTKKINNAIQVLLQIAFFKESEDNIIQQKLCNLYIYHKMDDYSMGSFSSASNIIDAGIQEGRDLYPVIKRLKDSLDNIYGPAVPQTDRLPQVDSLLISHIDVKGLVKTTRAFFVDMLGFKDGKYYTRQELERISRRVYGTRYYSKVVYYLQPQSDNTTNIVFDVTESPTTFAKLGLYYNDFTGASIVTNLTSRNYFTDDSRSSATLNAGETFRLKGQHLQYLGRRHQTAMIVNAQYETPEYNSYSNFRKDGLYRNYYALGDLRLQKSVNRIVSLGVATRIEYSRFRPIIQSVLDYRGDSHYFTTYLYMQLNTLDRPLFPRTGWRLNSEGGYTYGQRVQLSIKLNGQPTSADSLAVSDRPYVRYFVTAEHYKTFTPRSTIIGQFQAGINYHQQSAPMNNYFIGGLNSVIHNQITFAGLPTAALNTSSVGAFMLAWRYEATGGFYVTTKANLGVYNFVDLQNHFIKPQFLSGYSLTFSLNTPIGPLEVSAMYSDQVKQLLSYVNIGIAF